MRRTLRSAAVGLALGAVAEEGRRVVAVAGYATAMRRRAAFAYYAAFAAAVVVFLLGQRLVAGAIWVVATLALLVVLLRVDKPDFSALDHDEDGVAGG